MSMHFCTGYVGTYSAAPGGRGKGIYSFRMDSISGEITGMSVAAETANPSWLCLSGHNLYAANELDQGAVSAYQIRGDGSLSFINQKPSGGDSPCHLALRDNVLIAANYGDGTLAVLSIEDSGAIGDTRQHIRLDGSGPVPLRQEGPHAHAALFSGGGDFLLAHDLGSDRVMVYRFDPTAAEPLTAAEVPWYTVEAGSGPRHGVYNHARNRLYSVNELDSTLDVFRLDPRTGSLERIQRTGTLSGIVALSGAAAADNLPAEINISPDGKLVCVSNRGHDSIAVYTVLYPNGLLDFIGTFPTEGKFPRHFAFDPSGNFLIAANQESDTLTVFRIDTTAITLTKTGEFPVPSPVCVVFT